MLYDNHVGLSSMSHHETLFEFVWDNAWQGWVRVFVASSLAYLFGLLSLEGMHAFDLQLLIILHCWG